MHTFSRSVLRLGKGFFGSTISAACFTAVVSLGVASTSMAAPITGDPQPATPGWDANSTNALNYAQLVPDREGQIAPYVLFDSNAPGSVILDFFNFAPGLAFFEVRIDGIQTGATAHHVIPGSTIHSGGKSLATGTSLLDQLFMANNYVDVRLALGGERDWDFDWTRFEVLPNTAVSEPAMLGLFGLSLLGLTAMRRRRIG